MRGGGKGGMEVPVSVCFIIRQIPYPKFEMGMHVSLKCAQAGAIGGYFGSRLFMVYQRVIRKQHLTMTKQELLFKSCRSGRNFMFVGLLLSLPMFFAHGYSKKVDYDGYYDRVYRLRYNECQLNVDRLSLIFATIYGTTFKIRMDYFY